MSSFVFISFYHLSICIHFLSCSFDVAFSCCINFLSFCCHVLSCSVAMYQRYRSCIRPNARVFFHMSLSFLLLFSYCFGGLCRLPSSGFMNMDMYKLVIVFVTLIVFWVPSEIYALTMPCMNITYISSCNFKVPNGANMPINKAQGKCPSLYARPGIDFHHFHARCWHSKSRPWHRLGHRKMLC